ncbi:MAG: hypothetical protein GWP05_11215 [Anaerolineaceae bacterium]|nr:hypothetical protein [Anaerolineaceae bacterium]
MDSSEGYRLLFYRQWMSLPLLVAALAACVLFVVLSYRLVYRVLPRRVLIVLACLRSAAVLLVLLLIFQPILRYSHTVFKRTSICILADTSRSMSVRDYPNSPSRVQRVAAELRGRLGQLGETFDLHLYTFDSIARRVNGPLPTEAAGEATDLSRAVTTCLAEVPRENLSALVILSDGIHNGPGDALQAILAASPPPIYTVGVGSDLSADSGFKDIGISALEAPDQATVNTQTEITVRVEATGFADRAIEVQIRDGRTVVAAGRLVLDGRPGAQALRLQIRPERTGQRRYEVVIPGDPKERIEENNRQEFYLMVTEPKIRVLYIETLRPEYGPLKRVLETDPNIDVLSLVQIQKGTFLKSGNLRGLDISAFPRRREQMRTFDVFIIGNLDSSFITRGQAEALRDLVREEGKGLLMIGGSNSLGSGGYGGTALEDALPVELGRRSIGQISQPFTMELTAEGREHPIFAGTGEFFSFRGRTAEKRLPVLLGCNRLGPLKPGAAVLAVIRSG